MRNAQTLLEDLLRVDTEGTLAGLPMHRQIYTKIRLAILDNVLPSNTPLPPTRHLAQQLKLSRNTVITAYDQLTAEGLITSQQGSGTRVCKHVNGAATAINDEPVSQTANRLNDAEPALPYNTSFSGTRLLPGLPDMTEFPYKTWNQLFNRNHQLLSTSLQDLDLGAGYRPLRHALSQYLKVSRGVRAEEEQIFITAGASQSLHLITRVLTNPGDVAWFEEPGYRVARMALQMADLKVTPVPVDQHGMAPQLLTTAEQQLAPSLIYLTPSFQYPLGHTMPIPRRLELLNCASELNAWLIEDDYDGEFRYQGQPIPAIAGLQDNQRTLYMGTFSKNLSPAFRMSYVVVPPALVDPFRQIYPMLGNESSTAIQATLAEFISRGYLNRHIKRMRKIYGSRRQTLEQKLRQITGSTKNLVQGGLHIPVTTSINDNQLPPLLNKAGLGCVPLSQFYLGKQHQQGLLIGFTDSDEENITAHCKKFAQLLDEQVGDCTLDFV